MDARLVDLNQISRLLSGADCEAIGVVEQIRRSSPEAWDSHSSSEKVSVGQVLESLLLRGEPSGQASQTGLALQLLIRELGEPVDTSSFDDARMIGGLAVEAMAGLPCAEMLYGRGPPPIAQSRLQEIVVGYVTPEEAATMLEHWPEPDYDDPAPEIYAGVLSPRLFFKTSPSLFRRSAFCLGSQNSSSAVDGSHCVACSPSSGSSAWHGGMVFTIYPDSRFRWDR